MNYEVGQILVAKDPLRVYKITAVTDIGYNATYIGPGTQTIDNALVSISYVLAAKTQYIRLATPAEQVLYT